MIFFYRVRANFITVPQNHIVYLTQAQRQRYSDLDLEEYDYVKPGWVCCLSWEGITVGCGEFIGFKRSAPTRGFRGTGGAMGQGMAGVREWQLAIGWGWTPLGETSRTQSPAFSCSNGNDIFGFS